MTTKHINYFVAIFFILTLVCWTCSLEPVSPTVKYDPCAVKVKADFSTNTTTCISPCSITLKNTSTGATTYLWDFGNGQASTEQNPPLRIFSVPNTYIITLVAKNAKNCSDSLKKTVVVSAPIPPNANFQYSPTTNIMAGSTTVTFTNLSTGSVTNSWDFGGEGTSNAINPSFIFKCEGIKTVSLTASGLAGSHTTSQTIQVYAMHPTCNNYADGTSQSTVKIQSLRSVGLKTGQVKVLNNYTDPIKIELFHPAEWLSCSYKSFSSIFWTVNPNITVQLINQGNTLIVGNDWGIKVIFSSGIESCVRTIGSLTTLQNGAFTITASDIYE